MSDPDVCKVSLKHLKKVIYCPDGLSDDVVLDERAIDNGSINPVN
jgi:hypothetical protein